MGAKHGLGISAMVQSVDDQLVGVNRDLTKVNVIQFKASRRIHRLQSRGQAGAGTVFPINAPVDDRGLVAASDINITIGDPRHHYVKIDLNSTTPTIHFLKMFVGLSSLFTIDLRNNIAMTSITFDPVLSNQPALNLGITERNIYLIQASGTVGEIRFEVIGGTGGGSSSPLTTKGDVWGYSSGDARIPVGANDEVLTADSTTSLGVAWKVSPGGTGSFTDAAFDVHDEVNVNARFKIDLDGATDTFDSTLVFTQTADRTITFVDADLTVAGLEIANIFLETQAIAKVDNPAILNLFRDDMTPVADDALGEIFFDGRINDGPKTQFTYAKIRVLQSTIGPGGEEAEMRLDVVDGGSLTTYVRVQSDFVNPDSTLGSIIMEKPLTTQTIYPNSLADIGRAGDEFRDIFVDFVNTDKVIFDGGTSPTAAQTSVGANSAGMWFNVELVTDDFVFSEAGTQYFKIDTPTPNNYELFLGPDPFTAGETYRIVMGENSGSSGIITHTEGSGNDFIINRSGGGSTQGVQIQAAGLTIGRFLSNRLVLSQNLDMQDNSMVNVVDITSNGAGGASTGDIGQLISFDGGFDYFVRDKIIWDQNAATNIEFTATAIILNTNGSNTDINLVAAGATSSINITATDVCNFTTASASGFNFDVASGVRLTIQDNFVVMNVPISMQAKHIEFLEQAPPTQIADSSLLYSKDVSTVTHLFTMDSDGVEHDLSLGGGGGGTIGKHSFSVNAGGFISVSAQPFAFTSYGTGGLEKGIGYIPFSDGVSTFATYTMEFPGTLDLTATIDVIIYWKSSIGGSGNVVWGASITSVSDGVNFGTTTYGTEETVTTAAESGVPNANQIQSSVVTIAIGNTPIIDDQIIIKIQRRGGDGADTYANDVQFESLKIIYETDAGVDP